MVPYVKHVVANLNPDQSDDEFSVPVEIPKTQKSNLTIKSKIGTKNFLNFKN